MGGRGAGVIGDTGAKLGTTGYYEVPLGSVKYCSVFLGYWVVLRVNRG